MDNLAAMRADGEISKEQFQSLRHKAEIEIAALNEERAELNTISDEAAQTLDMGAIEKVLNEVLDFSKPTINESVIDKFVARITPADNGHYRWDLNFAPSPNKLSSVILRDVKATVMIKEYGENDEHSHRTYDRSIQFSSNCPGASPTIILGANSVIIPSS